MKINNINVVTPASFSVTISDIDIETNRSANGNILRDRVAVKRKLECKWNALNKTEMQTILNACSDVFFTVTYLDPMLGNMTTKTFYAGDRNAPVYTLVDGNEFYSSLSLNFIER